MLTISATKNKIVAVGASGSQGLSDLYQFLEAVPGRTPATILVVLHRPFQEDSALAALLQRRAGIPVSIVNGPARLQPGHCYVGHPARHLIMTGTGQLDLVEDSAAAYRNATVDLLFSSVAEHASKAATGIVLSGTLSDGSRGLADIKAAGGITMARKPCETFLSDMARNAIRIAGPLDQVRTPQELASYLG
jgi:chemotaxis response regulator CheB